MRFRVNNFVDNEVAKQFLAVFDAIVIGIDILTDLQVKIVDGIFSGRWLQKAGILWWVYSIVLNIEVRLVVKGNIVHLRLGFWNRSGICVNKNGGAFGLRLAIWVFFLDWAVEIIVNHEVEIFANFSFEAMTLGIHLCVTNPFRSRSRWSRLVTWSNSNLGRYWTSC